MKKIIILAFFFSIFTVQVMAQSSMTDEQVISFVMKEQAAGKEQSEIIAKLMQRGVSVDQLKRIKKKYERQQKGTGLGVVSGVGDNEDNNRLRQNNGKRKKNNKEDDNKSSQKLKDIKKKMKMLDGEDPEQSEDFIEMDKELSDFMPDSMQIYRKEYMKRLKKKDKDEDEDKIKVFGRDIFNNEFLSFEPAMNIATPANYRLGPGDNVFIDIYGASQQTIQSTISPEGSVVIEGYGPVYIAGMTVEQANDQLSRKVGARYSSSKISLSVGQTRTISVNVMGEVKVPGTYTLSAFATVFHAMYMAGGVSDIGTLRNIKVYRNNRLITTVDIYDYILNGKLKGNVRLADDDVIVVSPYDCMVNIAGKVKRPMYYEMKNTESVGTLLRYAGGFAGDAYKKSVRVIRKTGREYSIYNVEEFDFNSFKLTDQDSLTVDSVIPRFENMVEIKGSVFRPGMYQVGGDINTVKSLIEHAEGLKEEAFTAHAVMHRMLPDRTLEVIPVDVDGIMSGKVSDIPLQKNDVLFIPTKQQMMKQQTVTIHGEVYFPGVYKYAANQTIEDLVLQAGGLKDAASTVKVDVSRRVNDPKSTKPRDVISETFTFSLKDGFIIDYDKPSFTLMPFDEVYIRKSPGYFEQQNVEVDGQVMFAGTYTLNKKNVRLSDIVKAAGGLNDLAYAKGARLERKITPTERIRMDALLKMAEVRNEDSRNDTIDVKRLDYGDTYYVGIELDKALDNPGGTEDLVLREGDRLVVPTYNGTVKISGEVMYPNTVAYTKGKKAGFYIDQAGGWSNKARKNRTFIIYMNGTVQKLRHGVRPEPGCEIVVPAKPKKNINQLQQTLSIASTAASIATMIATLTNILKD